MQNQPIRVYGDGSQSRCFAYVSDVVGALVALANHPDAVGQIFNIGSNEEITIMELASKVKTILGSQSEIIKVPYEEAYEQGFEDMARRVPDLTKIKKLVGYTPNVKLDEIILRVWDYFKELERNGKLSEPYGHLMLSTHEPALI
jgi:UDP-glucose 4-epimerase